MPIRRHSLLMPCRRLEDFPTHITGDRAAELLAAWTALWHPALIAETGALPGWHPADDPPDPAELDGELVLIPGVSRERLPGDWCDRLRETSPRNPQPVEATASRQETIDLAIGAAAIGASQASSEIIADFLVLGHAHFQVELLTRAMHYTSVLDTEHFTNACLAAARAAVAGNEETAREEIARAFDLLADARNHVYSVDYYIIDVTLLADSTLGDALRAKLAAGSPTSLLVSGELLERLAGDHPDSLSELRRAIEAGTACVIGGMYRGGLSAFASAENILSNLERGQLAARSCLDREIEIFAQFDGSFSPLLPEILAGMGFRGALHAAFDGSRLPRATQCKTFWGNSDSPSASPERQRRELEALSITPLDISLPETWLQLAQRIGDSIARDHVATVVLAGWPGSACEYYDDLRRAARYSPVLGKLVTLEEYFRITREPDEWTTFYPRQYSNRLGTELGENPISSSVAAYRRDVIDVHRRLADGLVVAAGLKSLEEHNQQAGSAAAINPWNFARPMFVGFDPLAAGAHSAEQLIAGGPCVLTDVPGCGFAACIAAPNETAVALVDGRILRNERFEVTVSEATGGIQSIRTHRDRSTRLSQRLAFHKGWNVSVHETQMIAEKIEITRNDPFAGEITSTGRLLDAAESLLARFTQKVRVARGLPAAIVDVELVPERLPTGDAWRSYYASRLAWADDAITMRRGMQWIGGETERERIETPEWIEVNDGIGTITCFPLGLPLHRRASGNWLDTLLIVAGEEARRFQFALAIDDPYPTQTALALVTAAQPHFTNLAAQTDATRGWFLHVGAKNVVITHLEPLAAPRCGVRLRLLETEGRIAHSTLEAFRLFNAARTTDFRGNSTEVLSVAEGRVEFDLDPHRWIQIEADW